jgi:hypothetical protein
MAEIWYDSDTMEVEAVYSGRYTGTAWADRGYTVYADDQRLPRGITPGAVIDFDRDGKPVVVTPAPEPEPPPRTRLDDLHDKLAADTITDAELREMLRLERGL